MPGGGLFLLLGLKFKLLGRVFTRRRRGTGVAAVLVALLLALAFSPFWLAMTAGAYAGARYQGMPAVAAGFGLVHFGWIAGTLLLGSFAEGIDLRALLRYPVGPRAVFALNVLIAPLDLTALFLAPPLGALAAGTAARDGTPAGLGVALAALLLLLITSAVSQTLLALLGRNLRREWTLALCGLLIGVLLTLPAILLQRWPGLGTPSGIASAVTGPLPQLARAFAWLPTTALAVLAAGAAAAGTWVRFAVLVIAAALLLLALIDLGSRVALNEALNRQAPVTRTGTATGARRGPARRAMDLGGRALGLLPADLAAMVGRELRYFLRTPQVLIGLLMVPVLLLLLPGQLSGAGTELRPFVLTFLCLTSALNLSGNQFGLDHAGVRLLFLLPIPGRRILLAKNLALTLLVAAVASAGLLFTRLTGPGLDALGVVTTLVTLAAALPVVLAFGCFLSIYHPWRMVFRLGGAPPGAMFSAFAQLAALGLVALLLFPPLVLLPILLGDHPGAGVLSLAATVALAGVLWLLWWLSLGPAARALDRRREVLIDRLARATENG